MIVDIMRYRNRVNTNSYVYKIETEVHILRRIREKDPVRKS